jgi:heat shock protein HslJ
VCERPTSPEDPETAVRRPTLVLAGLAVLALLLGACGGGSGSGARSVGPLGGDWVLTAGTGPAGDVEVEDGRVGDDPAGGVVITLGIDEDRWGGNVCNSYGAQEVEVDLEGSVVIGDVSRTEMACLDEGVMAAEEAYLAAFVEVTGYEVTGDELRLTGEGVELVYVRQRPEPPAGLVGTVWVLDTLFAGAGPDGSASTTVGDEEALLELADDGTFTASSGCVVDGGDYELDGSRLLLRFASDADDGCGDDELRDQDTAVWRVLGSDPEVELDGQRLTLTVGDEGLGYAAREVPSD